MIYTLTLNPAVDYHIKVNELKEGSLNLAMDNNFFGGGKGVNISKVLNNLGIQSTAFGFIGGFSGDLIKKDLAKNLITWVSYMLPFVISGGILIALAFLFDKLSGIDGGQSLVVLLI